MAATKTGPEWLYLPLPANAAEDAALAKQIEQHCNTLPDSFKQLQEAIDGVQ